MSGMTNAQHNQGEARLADTSTQTRASGASALPPFEMSYADLPARFHARPGLSPVLDPRLVKLNDALARDLGLDPDALKTPEAVEMLAGSRPPNGAPPIAQAYAGHQFGNFVPQLGDGRAMLLGEVVDQHGRRRDIQLKGSGPTPFSRGGDGRAALGPVLREYILGEAMAALGIPTTRSLAVVTTGEKVYRDWPLPGAILTRVAASHIRVGTFQYFAARGDTDGVRALADHVIARHYPEIGPGAGRYLALLDAVIAAQARLVASWMLVGFIHGVMNTDNMTVSGETIDYGPCAFMDEFEADKVFSSIDRAGRYAYSNQPHVAVWNLARLAETLLPLIADDQTEAIALAEAALRGFQARYEPAFHGGLRAKLGLLTSEDHDIQLASDLFALMAEHAPDFTLTFRGLIAELDTPLGEGPVRSLFAEPAAFDAWSVKWRDRLSREPGRDAERRETMRTANPAYIPRNHRVEEAIRAAEDQDDFAPFETLVDVLQRPFDDQPDRPAHAMPPQPHERVTKTFCGT
jgi:serine/tyrosine/threonine adenylyltransferase